MRVLIQNDSMLQEGIQANVHLHNLENFITSVLNDKPVGFMLMEKVIVSKYAQINEFTFIDPSQSIQL